MIYFAILSTFLGSWATITWKHALSYNVPKEYFKLLANSSFFLVWIVLYLSGLLDFAWVTVFYVLLLLIITIGWNLKTVVAQKIYSQEKISTLMPYTNINKILSIILAFFIFWNISKISFIITLIAVITITIFSIDFKTLKIPKNIWLFSILEIIQSWITLITWYILLEITSSAFFVLTYIIWIIFMWSIVAYKWQFKNITKYPVKFYIYRLTACHLWWIGYLLSIFVIKNLWVSISLLLSFIWIWITLLFSYVFLKDKPTRKNIALTIIVSALVWFWYYLK